MKRILTALALGILALICALPGISLGASLSALYYAIVKSVRHGMGKPFREFFRAFKQNFLTGFGLTSAMFILLIAAYASALYVVNEPLSTSVTVFYFVTLILTALWAVLILLLGFPALSRFRFKTGQLLRFTVRMACRFPLRALALVALNLAALLTGPVWPLLLGPGTYIATYIIEPILLHYTPSSSDWYWDTTDDIDIEEIIEIKFKFK